MKRLLALLLLPSRYHFLGSLLIVMVVSSAIATQMTDRRNFASSELYSDVMDRWGAPIVQPGPSVRYVPSGAVFNSLAALPLQSQEGDYSAENDQGRDIDIAFVFPINMEKNKVLLSNLVFTVDGEPKKAELDNGSDRLLWTGRLKSGAKVLFRVEFRGRGLDAFVTQQRC